MFFKMPISLDATFIFILYGHIILSVYFGIFCIDQIKVEQRVMNYLYLSINLYFVQLMFRQNFRPGPAKNINKKLEKYVVM